MSVCWHSSSGKQVPTIKEKPNGAMQINDDTMSKTHLHLPVGMKPAAGVYIPNVHFFIFTTT